MTVPIERRGWIATGEVSEINSDDDNDPVRAMVEAVVLVVERLNEGEAAEVQFMQDNPIKDIFIKALEHFLVLNKISFFKEQVGPLSWMYYPYEGK